MAEIEMLIDSIRVSAVNDQRVVILKEKIADRFLPIWIGPVEADVIAIKLQNVPVTRPLTHDFVCDVINALGATIKSVVVCELKEETFLAKVVLESKGKGLEIDCRPSDALAVAVRVNAPIFADEKVLEIAGVLKNEEGKEQT
ncbi:MAG: bifunctional nuclease family protein [Dehalococcoidia bacterium]|jgi:bifunctional DNase/RNase